MMHEKYMERCLELAQNGIGYVSPNPLVGCVIVHQDNIIGEGFHAQYGKAHAEVNAINSVKDKSLLAQSELYVNLEPCAHFGKTPPCVDLILQHKIPKVIIGCEDSFSQVAGRGIEKLRINGVDVVLGVKQEACREINRRFFTFHEKKRPYIILKWAQTLDGFLDKDRQNNFPPHINWISNKYSKMLVHYWRSQEHAIMVGTNTAINDNPKLNVRELAGVNPIRILIDRDLNVPASYHLLDGSIPTIVYTEIENAANSKANLQYITLDFSRDIIEQINNSLYQNKIQSVIVEGGAFLLNTLILNNLWDEARIIVGNAIFGRGVKAPVPKACEVVKEQLEDDHILFYRNQ